MILSYFNYYSELKKCGIVNDEVFYNAQTICDTVFLNTNPTVDALESYDANRITNSHTLAVPHPSLDAANRVWEEKKNRYLSNVKNTVKDDVVDLEKLFGTAASIDSAEIDQTIHAMENLNSGTPSDFVASLSDTSNYTAPTEAAADNARKVKVYGSAA